jgi:DNA-binding response OmpR family regulator
MSQVRRMRPQALSCFATLPPLQSSWICIEGRAVRDGMSFGRSNKSSARSQLLVLGTLLESDTIVLLELGADDYVSRPFSGRELLARVRVAVRRSLRSSARDAFAFDDVNVDFRNMQVRREGSVVLLTLQEFKILKFMVQNAERVISRDELLNEVWGRHNSDSRRSVDNYILRLLQKLEVDPAHPVHFRTVHGFGYKFVP